MSYEFRGGEARCRLCIQAACFGHGGVIMEAAPADGVTFHGKPRPLLTKASVASGRPVVGVYDPSYSRVEVGGRMHGCLAFTGISSMNPRRNPRRPHPVAGRRPGTSGTAG